MLMMMVMMPTRAMHIVRITRANVFVMMTIVDQLATFQHAQTTVKVLPRVLERDKTSKRLVFAIRKRKGVIVTPVGLVNPVRSKLVGATGNPSTYPMKRFLHEHHMLQSWMKTGRCG